MFDIRATCQWGRVIYSPGRRNVAHLRGKLGLAFQVNLKDVRNDITLRKGGAEMQFRTESLKPRVFVTILVALSLLMGPLVLAAKATSLDEIVKKAAQEVRVGILETRGGESG